MRTAPPRRRPAGGSIDENAPVTITIGDRPTPDKPADIAAFDRNIKKFTADAPEHHGEVHRDQVGRADLPGPGGRRIAADGDEHQLHRTAEHDPEQAVAGHHRRAEAGRPDQGPEPGDAEDRPGRQGPHLRRTDRRLLRRARLQPGAVHPGRSRPGQAADDLGRGPAVRQADHREDRQGRLRAADQGQHRWLDAHHDDLQHGRHRPERRRQEEHLQRRADQEGAAVAEGHALDRQHDGHELPLQPGGGPAGLRGRQDRDGACRRRTPTTWR